MLMSLYISLTVLAFLTLMISFFVQKDKLAQQMVLLGLSMALFGALAAASQGVEIVSCTSVNCNSTSFVYLENMWIFAAFTLVTASLFLIKSFDAFYFARGRLS